MCATQKSQSAVIERQPHRKEPEAGLDATHQALAAPRVCRRWLAVSHYTLHHGAQRAGTCHSHVVVSLQRGLAYNSSSFADIANMQDRARLVDICRPQCTVLMR